MFRWICNAADLRLDHRWSQCICGLAIPLLCFVCAIELNYFDRSFRLIFFKTVTDQLNHWFAEMDSGRVRVCACGPRNKSGCVVLWWDADQSPNWLDEPTSMCGLNALYTQHTRHIVSPLPTRPITLYDYLLESAMQPGWCRCESRRWLYCHAANYPGCVFKKWKFSAVPRVRRFSMFCEWNWRVTSDEKMFAIRWTGRWISSDV